MSINKEVLTGGIVGTAISGTGSAISLDIIDRVLSIACSVIGVSITIVVGIIIPLIKWYKKSKQDGKITKEEFQEGIDIIKNGVDEIKNSNKKKED